MRHKDHIQVLGETAPLGFTHPFLLQAQWNAAPLGVVVPKEDSSMVPSLGIRGPAQ